MTQEELYRTCLRVSARQNYLHYMAYCWQKREPLILGLHTRAIAAKFDNAIAKYRRGVSSYILITVPFRHGKSDLASRYFPPYILGLFPDAEIILTAYNQKLASGFSKDARNILRSQSYQEVFDTRLARDSQASDSWSIEGRNGKMQAIGLEGGATGKGADVLIVDDYLRGRKDAESPTVRDSQWETFTGNIMTRLAPVHIVIVLATPWHTDDIIGRIGAMMNPSREEYNPDFPMFERLSFPAKSESYPTGYLFPERFTTKWYDQQFASLGTYQSAGLLQCEPVTRGGNMLKTDRIRIVDSMPEGILRVRFWDLASTAEEIANEDPDYTAGAKVGVLIEEDVIKLYVEDVRRTRMEALARNKLIKDTAKKDGPGVWQGVEAVGGYKDAYTTLRKLLEGISVVHKCRPSGDKVVRAGEVEPIFEAGHVFFLKGDWNQEVIDEAAEFPAGKHDDMIDAIMGACELAVKRVRETKKLGKRLGRGAVGGSNATS